MNGERAQDPIKRIQGLPWGMIAIGAVVIIGGMGSAIFSLPFAAKQGLTEVVEVTKTNEEQINKLITIQAVLQQQIAELTLSVTTERLDIGKLREQASADHENLSLIAQESSELANEQKWYWDHTSDSRTGRDRSHSHSRTHR